MEKLTEKDYKSFVRLSGNKDFIHWKKVMDEFQLVRAMNLISATPVEGVKEEDILKGFRGGYQLWKKAINLIEHADTMIAELNQHNTDEKPIQLLGEEVE